MEKQGRTHKRCTLMDPPHMAGQKQDDQHEHTFSSYVRIRDVVLKTYLGRWTIGRNGEIGSGISVLPAWHDDDYYYPPPSSSSSYYYYHYYYHIGVSRWFFTGGWVTASPLKSPGLFSVFWPFSIMQSFGWSPPVRQLPSPPVPFVIL